jgi:hypothetical protein
MQYRDFDDALNLRPAEIGTPAADLDRHPVIAIINILAGALVEVLGPFLLGGVDPALSRRGVFVRVISVRFRQIAPRSLRFTLLPPPNSCSTNAFGTA